MIMRMVDNCGVIMYNIYKEENIMVEYRVVCRSGRRGEEGTVELPEVKVEGVDKWDALVRAAEILGLTKKVTISDLWKTSSVIKANPKRLREFRKEE